MTLFPLPSLVSLSRCLRPGFSQCARVFGLAVLLTAVLGQAQNPPSVTPLSSDQSPQALTTFIESIRQHDWPSARLIVLPLLDAYEGDAQFDFYYALLLLRDGQSQEAIFALERVLASNPSQPRARLELARAYYLNNNWTRSRAEFERVLASQPPDNVRSNIEAYLAQIEAQEQATRTQSQYYAGLDVGWNSNVNNGSTLSGDLAPNLFNLTRLSPESRARDNLFSRFRAGAQWSQPTSKHSAWIYGIQAQTLSYRDQDEFNQTDLAGRWQRIQRNDSSRSQLSISSGYSWVDGNPWQFSLGLGGYWLQPQWLPFWVGPTASTQLGFATSNDHTSSVSDRLGLMIMTEEAVRQHQWRLQYAQLNLSRQDSKHLEWVGISHQYQLDWLWPRRISSQLNAQHEWRYFQGDDLVFVTREGSGDMKRREDHLFSLEASVNWPLETWLQSRTSARAQWLHSNINAYSREQWVLSQSFTILF